jgi:hypothetical protein
MLSRRLCNKVSAGAVEVGFTGIDSRSLVR